MKKLLIVLLSFSIVFCFAGCTTTNTNSKNKEGSTSGTAYIDDCYIEITDCKAQISTYSKQFIAVVWVDFENNSDSATSLFFTAKIKAYQNGKELSTAYWIPSDHGIENDFATNIQPGYSISTGYAFALDDTSAPITVQICDSFDIISEKVYNL